MNSKQKKESIIQETFIVPSILEVKASEDCEKSVASDLNVENIINKSIEELFNEEKTDQENSKE